MTVRECVCRWVGVCDATRIRVHGCPLPLMCRCLLHWQVYKAHEQSIRRFQCRVQRLSAMVALFVKARADTEGAGVTEPEQVKQFTKLLTASQATIEVRVCAGRGCLPTCTRVLCLLILLAPCLACRAIPLGAR